MIKQGLFRHISEKLKKWREDMPNSSWLTIFLFKLRRIKERFRLKYIRSVIRNTAARTPQFLTNPDAKVEVHTVLNRRDLYVYIIAVKSFLRFYNDVRVVVHDDGSFVEKDIEYLKTHIKGVEIINKAYADNCVETFLKDRKSVGGKDI